MDPHGEACKGKYYCKDLGENLGPSDTCYFDPCPYKAHCTVYKGEEATACAL